MMDKETMKKYASMDIHDLLEAYDNIVDALAKSDDHPTLKSLGEELDYIEELLYWDDPDAMNPAVPIEPAPKSNNAHDAWWGYANGQCSHQLQPVTLDEAGHTVYCSAVFNTEEKTSLTPDFGLYADWMWANSPAKVILHRNEFIEWPDFSSPTIYSVAYDQIRDAWLRVLDGQIVEIGCLGGHGRTGTMAAAMVLMSNQEMTVDDAITYVQKVYCGKAVESELQYKFLDYVSYRVQGGE